MASFYEDCHSTNSAFASQFPTSFLADDVPVVPLPRVQLDSFAIRSGTRLLGQHLANVTFASVLDVFDAKEFVTDSEGLELLKAKLANVESIRAMRLSGFGKYGDYQSTEVLACFPTRVWKSVEVLDVDAQQLPALRNELTGSSSLQHLVCFGFVPEGLMLPSLKDLYVGPCGGDLTQILASLKAAFPPTATVELHGRKFQLNTVSAWSETQALPFTTTFEPFLHVLEQGAPLNRSTAVSLPHFEQREIPLAESTAVQREALREWCNSSLFEEHPLRKAELKRIKVAVLDSGIDPTHPDLNESLSEAANFVPGESFIDLHGHGTHCAGIIARANGGIAPGVQLYVAKVLNRHGKGSAAWVTKGVRWAIRMEVDIISMSLGMPTYHQGLHDAVQEAISKGIVVVCAAGNDGSRYRFNVNFPASIAGAIRVGSIGHDGASSSFSAIGGPQIDAAAIGENVLSTGLCRGKEASYRVMSGTSMATPAVAAICAMLLAYDRAEIRPTIPAGTAADVERGHYRLRNAHCMKDILGKLCFNSSQEVAKGRGSPDLAHVLRVREAFNDHLSHIC